MKKIVAILLMLPFLVAPFAFVHAQQQVSIKIQPTIIEKKIEPGDVLNFTVNVSNLGSAPETLYTNARNISGIGPDGHPIYSTDRDNEQFYLASWISFDQT